MPALIAEVAPPFLKEIPFHSLMGMFGYMYFIVPCINLTNKRRVIGFPLDVAKKGASGSAAVSLAKAMLFNKKWGLILLSRKLAINFVTPLLCFPKKNVCSLTRERYIFVTN